MSIILWYRLKVGELYNVLEQYQFINFNHLLCNRSKVIGSKFIFSHFCSCSEPNVPLRP